MQFFNVGEMNKNVYKEDAQIPLHSMIVYIETAHMQTMCVQFSTFHVWDASFVFSELASDLLNIMNMRVYWMRVRLSLMKIY